MTHRPEMILIYDQEAINKEPNTPERNGTWTLVYPPEHKKVVTSKWVFKIKRNPDGTIQKFTARPVARGHPIGGHRLRKHSLQLFGVNLQAQEGWLNSVLRSGGSGKSCSGRALMLSGGPISYHPNCSIIHRGSRMRRTQRQQRGGVHAKSHGRDVRWQRTDRRQYTATIELAIYPEFHKISKDVGIAYQYAREPVESGEMIMQCRGTDLTTADIMTKPLQKRSTKIFVNMMNFKDYDCNRLHRQWEHLRLERTVRLHPYRRKRLQTAYITL